MSDVPGDDLRGELEPSGSLCGPAEDLARPFSFGDDEVVPVLSNKVHIKALYYGVKNRGRCLEEVV